VGDAQLPSPLRGGAGGGGLPSADAGLAAPPTHPVRPGEPPTPNPSPRGGGEFCCFHFNAGDQDRAIGLDETEQAPVRRFKFGLHCRKIAERDGQRSVGFQVVEIQAALAVAGLRALVAKAGARFLIQAIRQRFRRHQPSFVQLST